MTIRVVLADDQPLIRAALRMVITDVPDIDVAGEAGTGAEVAELAGTLCPDVVVMDIRMPVMDGIEATRRMKAWRPSLGVVALTAQEDDTIVREMLVAGATGYVLKDSDGDDILQAVMQAALGGAVLSPTITPTVIDELTGLLAGPGLADHEELLGVEERQQGFAEARVVVDHHHADLMGRERRRGSRRRGRRSPATWGGLAHGRSLVAGPRRPNPPEGCFRRWRE